MILEIDSSPIELIDFIELDSDQKAMVLEWRNSQFVSSYTHTKKVNLDEHLTFIENLKNSSDKKYFLVKKNFEYIGVINLININSIEQSSELGLYKNPYNKEKGLGSILLNCIINYAFDILKIEKLKLEVYKQNIVAIKLYEKFGFKKIEQINRNNKEVVCMELENENR